MNKPSNSVFRMATPPSLKALPDAVRMLNLNMVHQILESSVNKDLNQDNQDVYDSILTITRDFAYNIYRNMSEKYPLPSCQAKAMSILKQLLTFIMEYDDFEFALKRIFKDPFAAWYNICISIIKLISSTDKSEEAYQAGFKLIANYLESMNNSDLCETQVNCLNNECNNRDFHWEQFQILIRFYSLVYYFNIDPITKEKAFLYLVSRSQYSTVLILQIEKAIEQDAVFKNFCHAVLEQDFDLIQNTFAIMAQPDYINTLIEDENGVLHSPLYFALSTKRDDIVTWFVDNTYYTPLQYPDWLLLTDIPNEFLHYVFDSSRRKNISIHICSYFIAHSSLFFNIMRNIDSNFILIEILHPLLVDLIRCENIEFKKDKILYIFKKKLPLVRVFLNIACTSNPLDQIDHQSNDFKHIICEYERYLNVREFKLIILYLILFHPIQSLSTRSSVIFENNKYLYLEKLSSIPDDLLAVLLKTYHCTTKGLKIWSEVYRRYKNNRNHSLLVLLESVFSKEIIQKNFKHASRSSEYIISTLFINFRLSHETVLSKIPTVVLDRISFFIDPKITRRRLTSKTQHIFSDLPMHDAIMKCELEAIQKIYFKDPISIDKKNSSGLTPLMLCLTLRVKEKYINHLDVLDSIFQFCLEKTVFINLSCTLILQNRKITLTPLHFAIYEGFIDIALKLIQWGASVNTLDSERCLPITYCHRKNQYEDKFYIVIQNLLKAGVIFDENLCQILSKRIKAIRYHPTTVSDGLTEFKQDYIVFVENEHHNANKELLRFI